jgi:hypothetical protein
VRAPFLAIMASAVVLAGCTEQSPAPPEPTFSQKLNEDLDKQAQGPDWGKMSLKLKPLMSEQEVFNTLGPPKSTDLGTYGQATPKPWACKTLHYSSLLHSLNIQMGMDQAGTWRVNSWNAS